MNISDIVAANFDRSKFETVWHQMFHEQRQLMEKYHDIELRSGANTPAPPWNINDKFVQWRIKDELWRFTEELAEADECIQNLKEGEEYPWGRLAFDRMDDNAQHFFEEIADALHFIIEATIYANLEEPVLELLRSAFLIEPDLTMVDPFWSVVSQFGIAANFLKNKPWKQTQMLTDERRFKEAWLAGWRALAEMLMAMMFNPDTVFSFYIRKVQVNKFRQESQY